VPVIRIFFNFTNGFRKRRLRSDWKRTCARGIRTLRSRDVTGLMVVFFGNF